VSASAHALRLVAGSTETAWGKPAFGRIAARSKGSIVVLDVREVWAFEARDRLCFVHSARGRFDVDVSLLEIETSLGRGFMRVHRRWLANVANIRELDRGPDGHFLVVGAGGDQGTSMKVPVSREHAGAIRARLLAGTIGFRQRRRGSAGHRARRLRSA